jgi:uncharacterized membrane protein YraQ (UPF0718 family)
VNPYQAVIENFFLTFSGIFYEALPWVVIGAVFAGLVQELPARRAPAVMLALGIAILLLTISPLPSPDPTNLAAPVAESAPWPWLAGIGVTARLLENLGLAIGVGGAVFIALILAQPLVNRALAFLGRERWLAIALSPLLGLVNPMCDCGVLVVMRRLLGKGLPLSCCTAFILAGPIINLLVASTTFTAFYPRGASAAWWMLGWRVGLGYLTALVTAFIVERQVQKVGVAALVLPTLVPKTGLPMVEADGETWQPLGQFLVNVAKTALHDFTDVIVLLIVGALLAAGVRAFIFSGEQLGQTMAYPPLAIAIMIVVAFLITLCSEADAFVAAALAPPMKPAALLAFLVFGPMIDVKIFLMYTRVFRPRLIFIIICSVALQVFVYSCIVHYVFGAFAPNLSAVVPATP